jgi:hypothetical protein
MISGYCFENEIDIRDHLNIPKIWEPTNCVEKESNNPTTLMGNLLTVTEWQTDPTIAAAAAWQAVAAELKTKKG